MNKEEIIEQQNAYYMAGYPSRRSENKMGKDEMKNKISMALKDPILQQGFEIVCKENTELQNENAKLKQYIENMYANHCGNCNRNILNTELKNRNQELLESCAGATMMYDHLTKTKEFLKWFVWYFREGCPNHVPYKHNVEAVEQFLNEVENTDTSSTKSLIERQRLQIESLEGQTPWKDIKDKSEVIGKLTQAKEIIKNLIDDLTAIDGEEIRELEAVKEAEQFINEEV